MATFFKALAVIVWIAGAILFLAYSTGEVGIIIGIIVLIGAFISGMFCMGISVILNQQDEILSAISRVNTKLDKQNNDNIASPVGLGYTQRKSLSERLSSDSPDAAKVWSCKKCGEVNPLSSSICKSCGSYK